MNKTGKVNGFRILCRMAMAELMLRKKEGRNLNNGYEALEFQEARRAIERLGIFKIQAIPTYADLMDYALCFMLRFESWHMLNHANIQLELASRIAPEFNHAKFLNDRKQDRQEAERQEDDEYEDQEETDKWLEEQRLKNESERNKQRKLEALAAQEQAKREYGDAIRFIRDNPQMEQEYPALCQMIREIAEREEFKTPYEVTL